MLKNKRGISLIVLIFTILVILILASVIVMSFNNNNPIGRANEAKFKSDVTTFRDELLSTHTENQIVNPDYVKEDINVDVGNFGMMRVYIPDITEEYANKLFIKKGELLYINDITNQFYDEEEKKWAKDVGIQAPYENVGDVDGDGKITQDDVSYLQEFLVQKQKGEMSDNSLSDRQMNAFDTYDDGTKTINIHDATALQNYVSGRIDSLPVIP